MEPFCKLLPKRDTNKRLANDTECYSAGLGYFQTHQCI